MNKITANTGRKRLGAAAVMLAFVFLAAWPATCPAQDATLENIVVTNTRDHLLLYMEMEGAFTSEMQRAIESGIPTTFTFSVELSRVRNFWANEEIADVTVTHTIKYDTLKKEFTVTRSEAPERPIVTHSFAQAARAMVGVDGLAIAPLGALERGKPYQIKAKAELSRVTLPLGLHYVLFFVSMWDVETDWYTIDFYY